MARKNGKSEEVKKTKLELARDAQGEAERALVAAEQGGDAKARRKARATLTAAQRTVEAEQAEEQAVAARKKADEARELAEKGE